MTTYWESLLSPESEIVEVNKTLVRKLGPDAALFYGELFKLASNASYINSGLHMNSELYVDCSISYIQDMLNMSPHRQRAAINVLLQNRLIDVFYGFSNNRMISLRRDPYFLTTWVHPEHILQREPEYQWIGKAADCEQRAGFCSIVLQQHKQHTNEKLYA